MQNGFYNMDCMEGMKEFPDKYFDLAIVDPPYGRNIGKMNFVKSGSKKYGVAYRKDYSKMATDYDERTPDDSYFNELFRVSKNQIIWGGNNFPLPLNYGWIFWDKQTGENDFGDGELAWTSFDIPVRKLVYTWNGMLQGNMKEKEIRIHPNQKPVFLYRWLLNKFAKDGDLILDTHVGSASSLIACEKEGFKYVGFEIDSGHFQRANARMKDERRQLNLAI